MKRTLGTCALVLLGCWASAYAAQDVVSAVKGTVKKVDSASKTVVVETADGTDHTLHYGARTVVHGARAADAGEKDTFHGVAEGSTVVVHYTERGGEDSAQEVDRIGEGGLKATTGTISRIDRGGKVLVVKGEDGTEATYHLSDHAAVDGGKDLVSGSEKGAKVTVYYTENASRKVAHFFESA